LPSRLQIFIPCFSTGIFYIDPLLPIPIPSQLGFTQASPLEACHSSGASIRSSVFSQMYMGQCPSAAGRGITTGLPSLMITLDSQLSTSLPGNQMSMVCAFRKYKACAKNCTGQGIGTLQDDKGVSIWQLILMIFWLRPGSVRSTPFVICHSRSVLLNE